jgi:cell wall-associated NlpC family hydrolase
LKFRSFTLALTLLTLFSGCANHILEPEEGSSSVSVESEAEDISSKSTETSSEEESSLEDASSRVAAPSSVAQSKAPSSASKAASSAAFTLPDLPASAVVTSAVCPLYRKADTASTLDTQALYNQPVTVKFKSGSFLYVTVTDGYTGYIKENHVTYSTASLAGDRHVVVTKTMANIADGSGAERQAPMGAELYGRFLEDGRFEANLPTGGTGSVSAADIKEIAGEKAQWGGDGNKIAETAKLFTGAKYLWGGVSINGIDCSGLTYISYRMNGITLPRDAEPQSKEGKKISFDEALPGDLVFFSKNTDKKGISHTGIYVGDGKFIHSSVANSGLGINALSEEYYTSRLVSIRRYY